MSAPAAANRLSLVIRSSLEWWFEPIESSAKAESSTQLVPLHSLTGSMSTNYGDAGDMLRSCQRMLIT